MATVREHVEFILTETVKVLDQSRPGLIDANVAAVLSGILAVGKDESHVQSEMARKYFGMMAARASIPAGIDYWQVKSRRSDAINSSPGVGAYGGESSQNYDRVQGLVKIDELLKAQLESLEDEFLAAIDGLLPPPTSRPSSSHGTPKISTWGDPFITTDPDALVSSNTRRGVADD